MKIQIRILFFSLMLLGALPVYSQDAGESSVGSSDGFALFVNTGFGISYNVYLEDAQNEWVDGIEASWVGSKEAEDKAKVSWLYGSFGIEPRYFTGNLVFGLPVSYYSVMESKRVVVNGGSSVESSLELEFWSVSLISNYKINLDNSNYLLLGGGAGLYFGTIKWDLAGAGTDSDTKWSIGWQTGLEYHWVWGNVDVYLGATSRFAEVITFRVHDAEENNMIAGLTGLYFSVGAGYRF